MAQTLNLPTGYYMATCRFSGSAAPRGAAITFGGKLEDATDTPATVGAQIKTRLQATGAPFNTAGGPASNSLTFVDILVKFGPLSTGPAAITGVGAAAGAGGGDPYSPNVALLASKTTLLGGRHGRGRMYIPGLTESDVVAGGNLASGVQADRQGRWTQFATGLVTDQIPMYLLHRYDPDLGQSPMAPTFVESVLIAGQVASQRHRLRA